MRVRLQHVDVRVSFNDDQRNAADSARKSRRKKVTRPEIARAQGSLSTGLRTRQSGRSIECS